MKLKGCSAVLLSALILVCPTRGVAFNLPAFKKKNSSAPKPEEPSKRVSLNKNIRVTETPDYIVLFFFTGAHDKRVDFDGETKRFLEISYKFSIRGDDPARLFGGPNGSVKVRFLDSEGFSLTEDRVLYKDLLRGKEYYGFARIAESKAAVLRAADIKVIKLGEQPLPVPAAPAPVKEVKRARKRRFNNARPVVAAEPEKNAAPEPSAGEKAAETVLEVDAKEPPPNIRTEKSPEIPAENPAAPVPAAAPAPPNSGQPAEQTPVEKIPEPGLTRGGITNDEVQGVIEAFDKKAPTVIADPKPQGEKTDDSAESSNPA